MLWGGLKVFEAFKDKVPCFGNIVHYTSFFTRAYNLIHIYNLIVFRYLQKFIAMVFTIPGTCVDLTNFSTLPIKSATITGREL